MVRSLALKDRSGTTKTDNCKQTVVKMNNMDIGLKPWLWSRPWLRLDILTPLTCDPGSRCNWKSNAKSKPKKGKIIKPKRFGSKLPNAFQHKPCTPKYRTRNILRYSGWTSRLPCDLITPGFYTFSIEYLSYNALRMYFPFGASSREKWTILAWLLQHQSFHTLVLQKCSSFRYVFSFTDQQKQRETEDEFDNHFTS